jgi:hypothetical protein
MKKLNKLRQAGGALCALSALIAFSPSASAVDFSYEDTVSGHAIGEAFTGGGFRINLQNFDMGTTYPSLGATGTSAGFGQDGGAASVGAGITALNGIQTAGPTGAVGAEDSWGIARIITITDLVGSVIWSEAGKNAEITAMFYGVQDFYIRQLANGFQNIDGTGLTADFYFQSKTDPLYTQYDPNSGSAGRTGLDDYTTVTDGTMFLRTVSVPDFIHDAGVLGGLDTEFNSTFNNTSGGQGQAYVSVTGGADAAQFDTNGFVSPFGTGTTADLFAQFTTVAPSGVSDWLVSSNDPVRGNIAGVPDSGSTLLMLTMGLAGLALGYRRRNRKV